MNNIKSFYSIVENPTMDYFAIRLTDVSPWPGFIYSYGKMQLVDKPNEDGTGTLKFDYDVEVYGISVEEETLNQPEFNKLLGDILIDIIEEGYATAENR